MTILGNTRPSVFAFRHASPAVLAGFSAWRRHRAGRADLCGLSRSQLRDIGLEPVACQPVFEVDARTMTRPMALRRRARRSGCRRRAGDALPADRLSPFGQAIASPL